MISGLALWKPVQFSELADLFGSFQTIRLVHFLCMSAIVAFILVHVTLALLVPQSLVAMVTGGPVVEDGDPPADAAPEIEATAVIRCRSRRTPSLFRPRRPVDQSVLTENRTLVEDINRRGVLRGAVSLGALTMLTGCDVTEDDSVQKVLRTVSAWNDRVQETIFRPNHLAPTFSPSQVVKPPRFNAYYDIEDVKPVDGATWSLELAGRIDDKRPWTAQQIYQLPEQEIIIRHICVEGWDYIGQWSGPNLRSFLAARRRRSDGQICLFHLRRRLSPKASTWRRRCIRRRSSPPNTPATSLADPFGYPLRLRTSTKLGYKNAKVDQGDRGHATIFARRSGASRVLTGSPGI